MRLARPPRQGHDPVGRGGQGRRLSTITQEAIHVADAHLASCRRTSSAPTPKPTPIATLALFENLNPILDQEGTRDAYRLDVDLLPMVHEMRRRGIRIDQSAAEQARDYCLQKRDAALAELSEQLGTPTSMDEIASPKWKAQTFDAHGIDYPRTQKGNPSFKAGKLGWMATHAHWLPQLIATANKYDAAGSKFLEGTSSAHLVGGRIYAEINPHRSESGGTKSFRFSYSDPPLQQMPSRDEELGPLIRSVFLPEEGEIWCTVDCSQQEFRLRRASRRHSQSGRRQRSGRALPQRSRHRLPRARREITGAAAQGRQGRQLRQDLRRRREEIRRDDRQAAGRGAGDLRPVRSAAAVRVAARRGLPARGQPARLHPAL